MSVVLTQYTNAMSNDGAEIQKVMSAAIDDLTALRATVASLKTDMDTLVAKLNADTGVTDTNYAVTTSAPSALTLTK